MAEEHQIEARILLRYDTYQNWMSSSVILLKGEAAIAVFPTPTRIIENLSNSQPDNTPPAIGIKIGDGRHYFYELPWVQAVAADVYEWAKSSTKPSYSAQEIQGLQNYIENYINGDVDVNISPRIYSLVQGTGDNINRYYLRYKETSTDNDWIIDTSSYIDLSDIQRLLNWIGENYVEEYANLVSLNADQIRFFLGQLNYNDTEQPNQFVTSVSESNGIVSVTRAQPSFNNIKGIVSVEQGGTGKATFNENEVLVGNGNEIKTIPIAESIENNYNLVPNYLVKQYVDSATSGLTGAMHFKGEATVQIINGSSVNPRINDYNFSKAEPGDVILGSNKEEYVWTGGYWRLLGDEGSYAIKGSITNADIADDANIAISKIASLSDLLNAKVDKVEGKSLSTNDFTTEYKQKLDDIEDNAQRNLIEHIYINGTEATPITIDGKPNSLAIRLSSLTPEEEEKLRGIENNAQVNAIEHIFLNEEEIAIKTVKTLPKSINIELIPYTEEEQTKLAGIAEGAQVNTVEGITVNGTPISPDSSKIVAITIPDHAEHENKIERIYFNDIEFAPNKDKEVRITIDEAALKLQVLKGAIIPKETNPNETEDVDIDSTSKKLKLARIAATGNIEDILQNANSYIVLNCGSSTVNIQDLG